MMLSSDDVIIRSATPADAAAIAGIYNHYVTETIITFEETPVSIQEMTVRVREVQSASMPWLVAVMGGRLLGFAFAGRWKGRCAYRFSAETTVYLGPGQEGRGFGSRLYGDLLPALKNQNIHAAIGGIALPNDASVALHEKFGFEKVAHFREVGFKFNRWIDVGYWECILRSNGAG